jgi:CheY-like chemotaxis protein
MDLPYPKDAEEPDMTKILVVDDDQSCRRLTAKVLSINGYSPVSAANGLEALDALRREPIDLVLLDLMMPEMDGLAFMSAMRKDPQWANVPVLVLSGVADLEFADKVEASGVQGYLVKSRFSVDELLRTVRRHLGAGQGQTHAN